MKKGLFSLGSSDLVKGGIMAALGAIASGAIEILTGISAQPPVYPTLQTLTHIVISGLTIGLIYIAKNFMTNSNDQFLKAEPVKDAPTP